MLYAIVDIGSSIMKYKIYDYQDEKAEPIIIHDKANGLINYRKNGELSNEGIKVLTETLKDFKNYSEKLDVKETLYYATASLREITNKEEVLSTVKDELNIDITILPAKEEAKLSYQSIKTIPTPTNNGILVDIGGASTEITIFQDDEALRQESIKTGVLKIYNKNVSLIYPTRQEQQTIIEETLELIRKTRLPQKDHEYLYAIGKTFKTIKKLLEHMNIKEDQENTIKIEDIDKLLGQLDQNTKENYKAILEIDPQRIHTIIPCLLIVKALEKQYNTKKVYVCDCTLQDGIMYNLTTNSKLGA